MVFQSLCLCSFHSIFFFKHFFLVDWSMLYSKGLICHTSTWINHRCMYVPSLLNLPPVFPPHSHLSRLLQSPSLSSLSQTANSHWLSSLNFCFWLLLVSRYATDFCILIGIVNCSTLFHCKLIQNGSVLLNVV